MSIWNLALAYVWHRRLVTAFTVLSVALGSALVLVVLNVRRQVERTFFSQVQHVDLVVGASGSETALVLTALFHADQPRGNVALEIYEGIREQRGVLEAYPFNLGDRYRDARIVGATQSFFKQQEDGKRRFDVAQGRLFEKDFELLVGAAAARRHRLRVGDTLVGAHGIAHPEEEHDDEHEEESLEHGEFPYTVVGILAPTGAAHDRAMFTTLESYWKIHAGKDAAGKREVTVVLLRVARSVLLQVKQLLPKKFPVMAVQPAEVLQRMFEQVLEPLEKVLLLYGYAIVAVAAGSILTTFYLATLVRQRDLAVLRALGATPIEIFNLVLIEAFILLVLGGGFGILIAQFAGSLSRSDLEGRFGIVISAFQFTPAELIALASVVAFGLLAAILPAWQAYRCDVASNLGRG